MGCKEIPGVIKTQLEFTPHKYDKTTVFFSCVMLAFCLSLIPTSDIGNSSLTHSQLFEAWHVDTTAWFSFYHSVVSY